MLVDRIFYIVLIPMVYGAFFIFIVGTVFRLTKIKRAPKPKATTLRVFPKTRFSWLAIWKDLFFFPQITRRSEPFFWVFFALFHLSLFFLFLGHLELIAEIRWIQVVKHEIFLGRGVFGILLIISSIYFLFRRFKSPYRELSVPEDFILLVWLWITASLGSHLNLATLYSSHGFDIPVEAYRSYLGSLIRFRPALPSEISESPHQVILVMHVLFANIFLMYFPFGKVMHSILSFFSNRIKRR